MNFKSQVDRRDYVNMQLKRRRRGNSIGKGEESELMLPPRYEINDNILRKKRPSFIVYSKSLLMVD